MHHSNVLCLSHESTPCLQIDDILTEPIMLNLSFNGQYLQINLLLPCFHLLGDAGNHLSCYDDRRQKETITRLENAAQRQFCP